MLRVLLLALALLAAQQSALAHGVWHAAGAGQAQQQDKLCPLHDALGTVAGALDAPVAAPVSFEVENQAFGLQPDCGLSRTAPLPHSRGPPAALLN
jgi:hypothetical protein